MTEVAANAMMATTVAGMEARPTTISIANATMIRMGERLCTADMAMEIATHRARQATARVGNVAISRKRAEMVPRRRSERGSQGGDLHLEISR